MTTDDQIRDEKLQKLPKYQLCHQAGLMNILLIKTIEDQGKKQVQALKDLNLKDQPKSIEGIFPKRNEAEGIKDELSKIKRYENKAIRDSLLYYLSKQPFDFRTFKTIRSLGEDIYNKRVNTNEADQ